MRIEDVPTSLNATGNGLTRRRLIAKGGVFALSASALAPILAACGSSSSSSAKTVTSGGTIGGTINFLGWQAEDALDVTKDFQQQHNLTIKSTYTNTSADIPSKFRAGAASGVDLLSWTVALKPVYEATPGVLGALDESALPNLRNIIPQFNTDEILRNSDGQLVFVPNSFGTLGLTYVTTAFKTEPQAWSDLLVPSLKGKITMPSEPYANLLLACRILGFDPSKLSQSDLGQVTDYLRKVVAQCKEVSPSYGDVSNLVNSGEVVGVWGGFKGLDIIAQQSGINTVKTNQTPSEGTFSFLDGYGIPPSADNAASAYAFINEMLTPKVNATYLDAVLGGSPVAGATQFMDATVKSLYPYDDLEGLLSQAPALFAPPPSSSQYVTAGEWVQRWTEISAGG
jgi:spermidine/putrescine transport system substrate-binding protein